MIFLRKCHICNQNWSSANLADLRILSDVSWHWKTHKLCFPHWPPGALWALWLWITPGCSKLGLQQISSPFKPLQTADHLPKIDMQNNSRSFWGSTFQLVIFSDVSAALRLELDGSRQDICSSYPPGVLHKVDSLSSSHGPSGSTAGTIPSPNTIRKRDLFIQPFKARIKGR